MAGRTVVSIEDDRFLINGRPTYEGRLYEGIRIEGLLLNARLVQGAFDDRNEATREMWAYPDGPWDPQRNTREFIAQMPLWREHGLLAFTINLQGGSPQGYSKDQPWHNSTFEADGRLRPDYLERIKAICDAADELGMAVILGYFYFGQDQRLEGDSAVLSACDNATDWLCRSGYTNVLVEIGNEVDCRKYDQPLIRLDRCPQLVDRVQRRSTGKVKSPAGRLLVGASLCGGVLPSDELAEVSDMILLHGNGVGEPDRIRDMVDQTRELAGYQGQPIVFNEDDHFDFEADDNNMLAAISRYASWGYFDFRMPGEGFDEGYQSVPVNWGLSSERKRGFFKLLSKVVGVEAT
jgi:hypothetical protein